MLDRAKRVAHLVDDLNGNAEQINVWMRDRGVAALAWALLATLLGRRRTRPEAVAERFDRLVTPVESERLLLHDQRGGPDFSLVGATRFVNPMARSRLGMVVECRRYTGASLGSQRSGAKRDDPVAQRTDGRDLVPHAERIPACVIEVPNLVGDNESKSLPIVRGDFRLVKSIERRSFADFSSIHEEPSPFGLRQCPMPWPGHLVVHVALTDYDGWLMINRRDSLG